MLSTGELQDLLISWLTLSLAFAWDIHFDVFLAAFPLYLVIVGTAFVLHELAHKFAAQRLGYPARYKMWTSGLAFALLLAFFTNGRFIFAAPGAVYVLGFPTPEDNAKISLAGPLTNLVVAYLALLVYLNTGWMLAAAVSMVNAFIGFFNMMPIFPLDGSKILPWNPLVYFTTIAAFLPLLGFNYAL